MQIYTSYCKTLNDTNYKKDMKNRDLETYTKDVPVA